MKQMRRWTQNEVEYLTAHYDAGKGLQECATALNRTKDSVTGKAFLLNITAVCDHFTNDEQAFMWAHYSEMGAVKVARLMGRESNVIKQWACAHGLKVSSECKSATSSITNRTWVRSAETRKRIGDGHRKHQTFYNQLCRVTLKASWTIPILQRDHFTCQECGTTKSHQIVVHHLRPFAEIRDNVIREHPELLLSRSGDNLIIVGLIVNEHKLSDGISLCRDCHKARHIKKRRELLETPERDNQQPSEPNVLQFVGSKVQRLTLEDAQSDKSDTSAPASTPTAGMI